MFALPAASAPPDQRDRDQPQPTAGRAAASSIVGSVVTSSSSMIRGLVSRNSDLATSRPAPPPPGRAPARLRARAVRPSLVSLAGLRAPRPVTAGAAWSARLARYVTGAPDRPLPGWAAWRPPPGAASPRSAASACSRRAPGGLGGRLGGPAAGRRRQPGRDRGARAAPGSAPRPPRGEHHPLARDPAVRPAEQQVQDHGDHDEQDHREGERQDGPAVRCPTPLPRESCQALRLLLRTNSLSSEPRPRWPGELIRGHPGALGQWTR